MPFLIGPIQIDMLSNITGWTQNEVLLGLHKVIAVEQWFMKRWELHNPTWPRETRVGGKQKSKHCFFMVHKKGNFVYQQMLRWKNDEWSWIHFARRGSDAPFHALGGRENRII